MYTCTVVIKHEITAGYVQALPIATFTQLKIPVILLVLVLH